MNSLSYPPSPAGVTVIGGDGVGPEVVRAAMALVDASGATIAWEMAEAGAKSFARGIDSGVPDETFESISRNKVVLKGPLETPIGHSGKSANVTLRKTFETFANIRPTRELPGIITPFSGRGIDLVIVRENVEDLYAGIEHMQTPNVAQCLKLISRLGCQRVSSAAFALAESENRSQVTVATKANIMKLTEGMFKSEFEDVATRYPHIQTSHLLIDNCAHQLVVHPEQFDIVLTTNMNGDIISDLASGLVGGLGVAPSANIGYEVAMFEAVHGSAPDIAGKDVANPTAMILSGVMMLRHVGQFEPADKLEQALFLTLEEGIHTSDIAVGEAHGTATFTAAVMKRLGKESSVPSREHRAFEMVPVTTAESDVHPGSRTKVGVDVFVESSDSPEQIAHTLTQVTKNTGFELKMMSNRGIQVWPSRGVQPSVVDHFRCRFSVTDPAAWSDEMVLGLLAKVSPAYRWMHVEKLESHNGALGFTKAQGEN